MRYYEDNINSNSYIEFSKNKSKANLKSEEVDNENKDNKKILFNRSGDKRK